MIYLLGIVAPLIQTHDYQDTHIGKTQQGPDTENWLGTDRLGRDIYTRVIWGIQTTGIITATTLITGSLFLGVTMGKHIRVFGFKGLCPLGVVFREESVFLAY